MAHSYWQNKFEHFEILTGWEKYKNPDKPKRKLNEYRLVKINFKLYLEVKTQKPDITFLTDLKHFNLIQKYTWHFNKTPNIYITTNNKNTYFHKSINAWKFRWYKNNKIKSKSFCITKKRTSKQAKQLAIKFKLAHNKVTGNRNGYDAKYVP